MHPDRNQAMRRRETSAPLRRWMAGEIRLREAAAAGEGEKPKRRTLTMLASTPAPIASGGFREVLVHKPGSIEMEAARALLINHNPDQIAGPITAARITDAGLEVDAELIDGAMLSSGVSVVDAIESGALRGVSIGYIYASSDVRWNEETRTATVEKWRLLEVTLTPIPADDTASLRSRSAIFDQITDHHRANAPKEMHPMNFEQWLAARGFDAAKLSEADKTKARAIQGAGGELPSDFSPAAKSNDESTRAAELASTRAALAASAREIKLRTLAAAHGVDVNGFDFAAIKDESEGVTELLKRKATASATLQPIITISPAVITEDVKDKARDAFVGAMAHRAGFRDAQRNPDLTKHQVNNPLLGRSIRESVRRYARLLGHNTEDWSNADVAYFALGKPHQMSQGAQRNANVTSSMFPNFVFLNAITKLVAAGYEMGANSARYRGIVSEQTVPDFKQFSIGALGVANLQNTAERMAFPELDKSEGVYNSTVKMWGGTIALTFQAMINDDTSQFDRHLRQAGAIADKTIDRRVFQKLLMGTSAVESASTWTANTTSGGSIAYSTADLAAAARAKLSTVRAALMNKLGLDGNPLGTLPRFLIVGPTREGEARGIIGAPDIGPVLYAQQVQRSTLELVVTPWLEAAALTGFSATSYYLLGDPNEVTGLVLSKIAGFETVQVQPYDSGAVAALDYKLWLPFEADLHSMTYTPPGSTSTTVVGAAQQGTT